MMWCPSVCAVDPQWQQTGNLNVYPLYLEEEASKGFAFAILRDNDGYLWIADDIGLKRYDGYSFRTFNYSPDDPSSLGSNVIPSLYLDKAGTLWAGGYSLNQYHPQTESFTRYDVSDGFRIWAMHLDNLGVMWVGGEGFGLRAIDLASKKVIYSLLDDPKSSFIRAMTPHGANSVWVVSGSGIYLLNTLTLEMEKYALPTEFERGGNFFMGAVEDRHGDLWLASSEGVVVVNAVTKNVRRYVNTEANPNVLLTNIINSVFEDSKGNIWIGTDKKGVQRYDYKTDSFTRFPIFANEYSFPPGAVNSIYEDPQGSLWFAVSVFGVRRISPFVDNFTVYKHRENQHDSLGYNNILDLMEDSAGNIWVATDGGGLDRLDANHATFTHYRHDPADKSSLSSDSVLALTEDQQGSIWIGTWGGGLNKLNPVTGKFTRFHTTSQLVGSENLASNNIFRIETDDSGLLYISAWQNGLQIFNPETGQFKSYLNADSNPYGITNFYINDILLDSDTSKVWLAGQNGLELFDPTAETFTLMDLGEVYAINDIHKQSANLLWLATSSGLIRYQVESGNYKIYSVKNGLSDQFLLSIEEDQNGYLWLGSQNGLNRFDPRTETFKTYTKGDGLAGVGFNRFSHLKTRSGRMLFGGSDGVTSFDPETLPINEAPPPVHLTKFEVYQTEVKPGDYPWFPQHIDYIEKIELPYQQRDITFEFTALNFISPADNRYKYRLLGLEDHWVEVGSSRRRVRYTNLDHGEYEFQVMASNNDGIWNPEAKTVGLIVLPPWWELWWMQSLFITSAATVIYIFIYWRLRLNVRREKKLKVLVAEKTEALKQLNADLERRVAQRTSELSIEVEERKLAEAKLFHMAFHDQLTGLPNRPWLLQSLESLIASVKTSGGEYALLFLDGDRFKKVNDTHGHRMGDMLLIAATERLCSLLGDGQHGVRLGGDEFTVLLEHIACPQQAEDVAQNIIDVFEKPFVIEQNKMFFRVSIGVLICGQQYQKPSQVLRDADVAMYRAKESGRGTYQVFDTKMRESALEMAQIESDLHSALNEQQFFLVYQPIIDLNTSQLIGFEALIRWQHPEKGLIPPDKFIPVAEFLGFIMDIGLWVLERACCQLQQWSEQFQDTHLPEISVNLSPLQLGQLHLIDKMDEIFARTGVPSSKIKMEITESALAENTTTVNSLLNALRDRGIELMIDDFGTGYSSLSYLDRLPVQTLKIDRKFIDTIADSAEGNKGSQEIVRATIMLAHTLNLTVVAEGIETEEQLQKLKEFHCDFGQGYLIARPMTAEAATEYLTRSGTPTR